MVSHWTMFTALTLLFAFAGGLGSATAEQVEHIPLCGVVPVINTNFHDGDIEAIDEFLARLRGQGLFVSVVRLDLGGSEKLLQEADETQRFASSPKVAIPSQREHLLAIGVKRLPAACKAVALFQDASIQFLNEDWVDDTLEALEDFELVQPFSFVYNRRQGDALIAIADFEDDMLFESAMGREPGQLFYGAAYGFSLLRNFDLHRGVVVEKLQGFGGGVWVCNRAFLEKAGGIFDDTLRLGEWRGCCARACVCKGWADADSLCSALSFCFHSQRTDFHC